MNNEEEILRLRKHLVRRINLARRTLNQIARLKQEDACAVMKIALRKIGQCECRKFKDTEDDDER